jgi:hypothetical protein
MVSEAREFLNTTSKKLALIEKKIQEMKLNIVIMSFYSDLKLIENTLLSYQAQGIQVNESLIEKVEKFKILLQSNKNLPKLGKKFIELTDEFYKLRKEMFSEERVEDRKVITSKLPRKTVKKRPIEYLSAYA